MVNKKDFAMRETCLSYFYGRNTGREERRRRKEWLNVPAFVI